MSIVKVAQHLLGSSKNLIFHKSALDLFLNLFMLSLLPYNMVFKPYNK